MIVLKIRRPMNSWEHKSSPSATKDFDWYFLEVTLSFLSSHAQSNSVKTCTSQLSLFCVVAWAKI
jgi:hypothetical protein